MYFLDHPCRFHVQSSVDENGHFRLEDTTRLIRYRVKANAQPNFPGVAYVFAQGLVDLGMEFWSFGDSEQHAGLSSVALTFKGNLFSDKLQAVLATPEEDYAKLTVNNTQVLALHLAFCESSLLEFYVPYRTPKDRLGNAGLTLRLSHGRIARLRSYDKARKPAVPLDAY